MTPVAPAKKNLPQIRWAHLSYYVLQEDKNGLKFTDPYLPPILIGDDGMPYPPRGIPAAINYGRIDIQPSSTQYCKL